jgi:hypothetical protein
LPKEYFGSAKNWEKNMEEERKDEEDKFYGEDSISAVEDDNAEKNGTYKLYNSQIANLARLAFGKQKFLAPYLHEGPWYKGIPPLFEKRNLKTMTNKEVIFKRKDINRAYSKLREQFEGS